ncbi:MAG: hypothetical protein ACE5FH_12120, partial [Candidatus Zixiibacteriota bacterium]
MTANARSAQFGLIILIALVAWPHSAKAVDYDEYKRSRAKRTLFEISFDKDEITIVGGDDNRGLSARLSREDIVVTPSGVSAAG